MQATITTLNRFNYNDVVSLVWRVMNEGVGEGNYKRVEAEEYVKKNSDRVRVLEVENEVMGMYAYYDNPNVFTLSFFALHPLVRSKRDGYKLFFDLKEKLSGKPVIIPVYNHNTIMSDIVKKRGVFVGRFKSEGDKLLDYYSASFGGEEW